jgi:hypothetical protein
LVTFNAGFGTLASRTAYTRTMKIHESIVERGRFGLDTAGVVPGETPKRRGYVAAPMRRHVVRSRTYG